MNREILDEMGYSDSVVFDSPEYDDAIMGVDSNGRVVYSYEKMVECLMREDGMTEEEAIEFIDYNVIGALGNSSDKPIVMYNLVF